MRSFFKFLGVQHDVATCSRICNLNCFWTNRMFRYQGSKSDISCSRLCCLTSSINCSSIYHLQQEKLAIKLISNTCSFVSDSKNPVAQSQSDLWKWEAYEAPQEAWNNNQHPRCQSTGLLLPVSLRDAGLLLPANLQMQTPLTSSETRVPFPCTPRARGGHPVAWCVFP